MQELLSKTKLTLWVRKDIKRFGKIFAKRHNESLSRLFSDYIYRLEELEKEPFKTTPIVSQLSGIIKNKKLNEQDYKKYLEKKHLNA